MMLQAAEPEIRRIQRDLCSGIFRLILGTNSGAQSSENRVNFRRELYTGDLL